MRPRSDARESHRTSLSRHVSCPDLTSALSLCRLALSQNRTRDQGIAQPRACFAEAHQQLDVLASVSVSRKTSPFLHPQSKAAHAAQSLSAEYTRTFRQTRRFNQTSTSDAPASHRCAKRNEAMDNHPHLHRRRSSLLRHWNHYSPLHQKASFCQEVRVTIFSAFVYLSSLCHHF